MQTTRASVSGRALAKPAAAPAACARGASSRSQPQRVVCRATTGAAQYGRPGGSSGSGSSGSSGGSGGSFGASAAAATQDAAQLQRRLADLQELLREAAQIALATGPRGIARSAQAAAALLSVARDQAQRLQAGQQPEAPPVVLRKLFERLGAT